MDSRSFSMLEEGIWDLAVQAMVQDYRYGTLSHLLNCKALEWKTLKVFNFQKNYQTRTCLDFFILTANSKHKVLKYCSTQNMRVLTANLSRFLFTLTTCLYSETDLVFYSWALIVKRGDYSTLIKLLEKT